MTPRTRESFATLAILALVAAGGTALAQAAAAPPEPPLMNQTPALEAPRTLVVTSTAFKAGGPIPLENSGYGASISPPLTIAHAPKRTKAFVVLMEDSDAQYQGAPILHWMAYDAPAVLPGGLPAGESLTAPVRLRQGKNIAGQFAYRGPHPSRTSPGPHHYHLEVFALDAPIGPVSDRAELAKAMTGHVLAQGELVGAFSAPPAPPSAPPQAPPHG
jgi:Raf kinase inhibitor-like YbhB/YbcL family protein